MELRTERLRLRPWRPDDLDDLARLNAEERVMEFMWSGLLTREQSGEWLEQRMQLLEEGGVTVLATQRLDTGAFIGWIGLNAPTHIPELAGELEVGWRLFPEHWDQGFATEGARASVDWGFRDLALERVISMYDPANVRSRRVMDKLGLREWKRVVDPRFERELLVLSISRAEWPAAT